MSSAQAAEMAEAWKNCFEEELICPICLHVFVDPVQLPCKHNFCHSCISEAWAKDVGILRCPECNQPYKQKPSLDKNIKLINIVEKFNALNTEKEPAVLQCILCRRGPALPALKVCLRCNAPCCQSHIQTHLQQPSSNAGHLLVDVEDVRAWSCPQHDEYRLYHCETEQVAVCRYCCFSRCAVGHGHGVCDVELRQNDIRHMLMKQQDRIDDRVQDIEELLYKLESDKRQVEDKVDQLKQEVRLQYQKMQQLLEEDLGKALNVLEKSRSKFCQENSRQVLQLNERRQEAKKMLSSVQLLFDKAENINFMKNTKPVKVILDRSQTSIDSALPPYNAGHLNSKVFLAEISKKEKNLRKMLEAPFAAPAHFFQSVPVYQCRVSSSGSEKRKHSTAFPESSANFMESSSGPVNKQQFLAPSTSADEGPSVASCSTARHIVSLNSGGTEVSDAQPLHHSSSVFSPAHYPNAGSTQQAMLPQYNGRKILMCTVDNCYCSSMPSVSGHHGHPSYPRSPSFAWAQEFSHPMPPPAPSMSQPMQNISVRGNWIGTSQSHRHPDFYSLYGEPSTKHYVTS
ncbi:E3 ubiquitin-protein ligase TRIM8a [Ictalurus punctatus]|uniref:E3 ubiquitin-protein ligase TRIM8 n=1 Tax=Ictalurus punctatus TaxID=7998 RepID=A0A2D0QP70_ICTPU|nr:E3 ubiquitin-protein ligase TRIM8a [Ictalurus punctatus]